MEAEILLVVGRRRIPGEITTEIQNGTAYFVPWYSVGSYQRWRPYGLHELPQGARVVIADHRQLHKVAVTVIGHGLRPELSKDGETKRYMVRMATEDRQAIDALLKRDGQSFSSWARTVLRRELIRRGK